MRRIRRVLQEVRQQAAAFPLVARYALRNDRTHTRFKIRVLLRPLGSLEEELGGTLFRNAAQRQRLGNRSERDRWSLAASSDDSGRASSARGTPPRLIITLIYSFQPGIMMRFVHSLWARP